MHTRYRVEGAQTFFVIADAQSDYHPVLRALDFSEAADGFAKAYPSDTPGLSTMYHHFAQHARTMVRQAAGVEPVPWEEALRALLERTADRAIDWFLVGSAALAVRGLDIQPHDLDVAVDAQGAHALGEVFADAMLGPVEDASDWVCAWFGRAFLFARIEWVGGVYLSVDAPQVTDFGPIAANRLETIGWQDYALRVPPLDLQLQVSERRGLLERARKIEQAMRRMP